LAPLARIKIQTEHKRKLGDEPQKSATKGVGKKPGPTSLNSASWKDGLIQVKGGRSSCLRWEM